MTATRQWHAVLHEALEQHGGHLEIVLNRLLSQLMRILLQSAGAQRGMLLLERDGRLMLEAEAHADQEDVSVLEPVVLEEVPNVPRQVLRYVSRTRERIARP